MVENGGYTELVHAGEGITIEKGKISAAGSGGVNIIQLEITDEYIRFPSDALNYTALNVLTDHSGDGVSDVYTWVIVGFVDAHSGALEAFTTGTGVMSILTFTLRDGYYIHSLD